VSEFSIELLQAVNNWQRGFSPEQRSKRAVALKAAAIGLDPKYRTASTPCYRQIALEPRFVMEMGLRQVLSETVSSWSESYQVACDFKGGVAPEGTDYLTVIVRTIPDPEAVVLNLASLYRDEGFLAAVEQHKGSIEGFWDGIGTYRNSQAEVVLEVASVLMHEVHAIGGHSAKRGGFLSKPHVEHALSSLSLADRRRIERAIARDEDVFGARWLRGATKDRVLRKWIEMVQGIKAR
jgi:hypothetical protein